MFLNPAITQLLKDTPNSAYNSLKIEFLYHSNKMEGSTYTRERLEKYLALLQQIMIHHLVTD